MAGPIALAAPLVAIVALAVLMLVVQPRRMRLVAIDERTYPELADLRRTAQGARLVATVFGLVVAYWLTLIAPGRGLALAPFAFAGVLVVGLLVGDLVTSARTRLQTSGSQARSAALESRRVTDYLPHRLSVVVAATTGALLALLAIGWLTSSPREVYALKADGTLSASADGPSYSLVQCSADLSECSAHSPYPGSFYGLPLLLALAAVLAAAAVAVVVAVRRPRSADPEVVRVDDIVRRRVTESIVAAVGVGVGATLCGVALTMASAILGNPFAATWLTVTGWACVVAAAAGIVVAVWSAGCLLVPGAAPRRVDRHRPRGAAVA